MPADVENGIIARWKPLSDAGLTTQILMEQKLPTVADLVAPTPTTPKLSGTVEDHAIEQYIVDSGRFLEEARVSTDISETLFGYGFDDEELSIGMALQHAAMKAYCSNHDDCPTDSI